MGNIAFKAPNNMAVFRYSFRNTGGSWPDDVLMVGGNKDNFNSFVSPACDELRITATYTEVFAFILAHLSKLNIISGLSFELLAGVGSVSSLGSAVAQTVPTDTVRKHDQSFPIADVSADTVQIIITGIGGAKLNIGQIVFCSEQWTRNKNYNNGAKLRGGYRYTRSESSGGVSQRVNSKLRGHNVTFSQATDAEYKSINHLIDYKSAGGLVVYQKDVSSTLIEDSYLAQIIVADELGVSEDSENLNTFSVDVIEAIA